MAMGGLWQAFKEWKKERSVNIENDPLVFIGEVVIKRQQESLVKVGMHILQSY